jgi:streptogramin lyase
MATSLLAYDLIPLPGEGPEDVVVGSDGSIYTGLLDGRILAVAPEDGAVREVARTGGRPLGLEATTDGRLLICDSPKGLLELDLETGALKRSSLTMAWSRSSFAAMLSPRQMAISSSPSHRCATPFTNGDKTSSRTCRQGALIAARRTEL